MVRGDLARLGTIPGEPLGANAVRRRPRLTLIGVLGIGVWAAAVGCRRAPAEPPSVQSVALGGRVFHLELALDPQARFRGLSDRAELADERGMLFVFPQTQVQHFVMRRCLVPIDLIFLDPGGRVIATHAMQVEPYDTPEDRLHRYGSVWPARFAIELKGGTLARLRLEPGAKVPLPLEALKRAAR